jgi:hypothetical protein
MKSVISKIGIIGLTLAAVSCGGSTTPTDKQQGVDNPGTLSAKLTVNGAQINQVNWTLTNGASPAYNRTGNFALGNAPSFTGTIPNIPQGNGYWINFTATGSYTDPTGGVVSTTCTGQSPIFNIIQHKTTPVTVHLVCAGVHNPYGSALVNGTLNVCPGVDTLSGSTALVNGNTVLSLLSTATDDDNAPVTPLTYSWVLSNAATGGTTLATLTGQNPTFQCTSSGQVWATLTVSDGDNLPRDSSGTIGCTGQPGTSDQVGPFTCTAPLSCTAPQIMCNSACTNPNTDPNNCGACGTACNSALVCSAGACICPNSLMNCGTLTAPACTNVTGSDNNNCGSCGHVCGTGTACVAGSCQAITCTAPTPNLCGNTCVNLQSDNNHCGTCATVCGTGSTCQAGACLSPVQQILQAKNATCRTCGTNACGSSMAYGSDLITAGSGNSSCSKFATQADRDLCLALLNCIIPAQGTGTTCADYTGGTVTPCYCGTAGTGCLGNTACGSNANANGACVVPEQNALKTCSGSFAATNFGDLTVPAGPANLLSQCLIDNGCSTCFN